MKIKIIIGILALTVMFFLASIFNSCSDSNTEKTIVTDQGITEIDSNENKVSIAPQSTTATTVDTPAIETATSEKEKIAENSPTKPAEKPSANKANTTNNAQAPPAATKPNTKPSTNETAKTSKPPTPETKTTNTIAEPPKTNPVSPTKEVVEKEEPKVVTPPEPEPKTTPEPVTKEPETPVVKETQPPKVDPKASEQTTDNWIVPAKDKNKVNPYKDDTGSLKIGKSLYNKHCASCHGKEGLGDGSKAKQLDTPSGDFTLPSFQKQTDGSLFYKTREGRGDMPEYKKKIPDEEDIWLIVNYMRTFK